MGSKYVYPYSFDSAGRVGKAEVDLCRESYRDNVACAKAIEKVISLHFDGMHLIPTAAHAVIAEYGYDRVNWVLANTLQQKHDDGRFSNSNKDWAKGFFIPEDGGGMDRRWDFIADSHPAVLDGFINLARKEYQALNLWDRTHCNAVAELDFTGKVMVLAPTILKEEHKTPDEQLFYATGGFGCAPHSRGRKVYGAFLADGEDTYFNREDFIGELKEENLPEWAAQKLRELSEPDQTQGMSAPSL